MSKVLAIVVGIAAGAIIGPLIVFALTLWVYLSASKSWDSAISIYILAAGAAAPFGGAIGALSGLHLQGRFELHVAGRGRRYVFVEGGGWHVTGDPKTFITSKSPPPEPCELDRTMPCAETPDCRE